MHDTKRFQHTAPRPMKAPVSPEPHHPLIEPSLFYDPPYERPLEDEFAWHLVKYLRPIAGLRYQVKVETPCMNAWVDFVIEHGDPNGRRRIGIEIGASVDDAVAQEEVDGEQERYRDALVIGSGALDVLYRFRATDLLYRPHDALYVAAMWDPTLFTERGQINLHTLASPEARPYRPRPHETIARVKYTSATTEDETPSAQEVPASLIVKRLSRAHPAAWMHAYDEALRHFGISDERLEHFWAKSA